MTHIKYDSMFILNQNVSGSSQNRWTWPGVGPHCEALLIIKYDWFTSGEWG